MQRRIRGHEAGTNYPGEVYIELYCRAFGLTREALFGVPGPDRAKGRRSPSEKEAVGLAGWIITSNTTDEAITRIDEARAAAAEAHTSLPPSRVLSEVFRLHGQVQALLQGGRQRLRQTRDLFRVDADLLAHMSLLLDDVHRDGSASAHSKAAVLCAEEAGYSQAFGRSAQAKTARWRGVRLGQAGGRYFARSADLARRGFERSPPTSVRVLLANQEASAAALLGDTKRARDALRLAEEAASRCQAPDSGLSVWSCPRPRQALYGLSVAIRLRDPDGALQAAEMADTAWAAGDPWLYGVWSLIRIGSGIAYVMKGDLDAAALEVSAVATLPPEFRISTITGYMADMDSLLRQRRFSRVTLAHDLREQIRAFTAAAPVMAGGGGKDR